MNIDFQKSGGLVPVIVQDATSLAVLMLGYMSPEAYAATLRTGRVVFFSRSRNTLWTKGESSGNYLNVVSISSDCDSDSLLIRASPDGPTCHTGSTSCFGAASNKGFMYRLEERIREKIASDDPHSYTAELYRRGMNKIAQKVGEEAVELVIEAKDNDERLFKEEAADLLYHFLILLRAKELKLEDIEDVLAERSAHVPKKKSPGNFAGPESRRCRGFFDRLFVCRFLHVFRPLG